MADECSDLLKIEERLGLVESDNLVMLELMDKMTKKIKELTSSVYDAHNRIDDIEGIDD